MNISYQREADRNYMVIDELPVDEESSALRILEEHPSEVFLRPLQRSLNGHVRILYEITSRQNIASFFERNPMTGSALFLLFNSLEAAMLECERYFIDPQDLLLEPEALYYSSAKHAVQFCYVPGSCKASPECFRLLAEFILKHLAHEDRSAVDLGYQFYELVCAENFSFLRSWSQMKTHLDPNVSASETPSSDKIIGDPAVFTRPGSSEEGRIVFGNLQEKESTGLKNTGFENTGSAALRSGFPVSDTDRTLGSSADENEKKKRQKTKKKASAKKLLSIILPIAGAAVLYGLILWFFVLTPLQMGGLFFLLCAAVWLLCSLLTNRRDMTGQINRLRPEEPGPDNGDRNRFYRQKSSGGRPCDTARCDLPHPRETGNGSGERDLYFPLCSIRRLISFCISTIGRMHRATANAIRYSRKETGAKENAFRRGGTSTTSAVMIRENASVAHSQRFCFFSEKRDWRRERILNA